MQDGFVLNPSDTQQVRSHANNTEKYESVFLHNPTATGGVVKITTPSGKDLTIYVPAGGISEFEAIRVWAAPAPPAGLIGCVKMAKTIKTFNVTSVQAYSYIGSVGATLATIALPVTRTLTLDDGSTWEATIVWDTSTYDPNYVGAQTINGTIQSLPSKTSNNNNKKAVATITLS